jgi:hypothetical protein
MEQSPLDEAFSRITGGSPVQLTKPPSLISYAPGAFDWKKGLGTNASAHQVAPVASADPLASYTKYDSAYLRPDGSIAVGNASNQSTPWLVASQQNASDPEIRATIQRNLASSQGIVSNLSSLNVPGTVNYMNPNLASNQKRVDAFSAFLNPKA